MQQVRIGAGREDFATAPERAIYSVVGGTRGTSALRNKFRAPVWLRLRCAASFAFGLRFLRVQEMLPPDIKSLRDFKRLLVAAVLALSAVLRAHAQDKVTYQDQVLPLIQNHCARCHDPDKKKGDLDLTSYNGALKGGGSGQVLLSGNLENSKLWKAVTHAEEPTMPPNKPKLSDKELEVFRKWIVGGLLETSGSKAIAANRSAVDFTVSASTIGKPEGPPPMPKDLPLEPVVHTERLGPLTGLANSPWAPLIAVAGQKQVLLYHSDNLELLGILPFAEGFPVDLKFSRNGKLLVAGGGHGAKSGRVIVWDIITGERLATLGDEYDTVLAADVSPDQSKIALGGPGRLVKIYSTRTGELQHKIKKHTDWVTALAFSPNGEWLASADRNGGISIWDPDNGQEVFTLPGHKSSVSGVSWRDDSKILASCSEDGTVRWWEMQEGKQAKNWNAHNGGSLAISFAHDGRLVTCGRDNQIIVWDPSGSKARSFDFSGELPLRVAFSHDGRRIFATDFSGRVTAWNTSDGKRITQFEVNPLPLAQRVAEVEKRIGEIQARGDKPSPALMAAETDLARARAAMDEANRVLEQAKARQTDKENAVARLKEIAANSSGPTDIQEQLAAARASRGKARDATTNALEWVQTKSKDFQSATDRLAEAKAENTADTLAAAQAKVVKFKAAQIRSAIFRARESLAAKKREHEKMLAVLAGHQAAMTQVNHDLMAAQDFTTQSKLKAALKAATSEARAAEAVVRKLVADIGSEQDHVDKLNAEYERVKTASSLQRAKL